MCGHQQYSYSCDSSGSHSGDDENPLSLGNDAVFVGGYRRFREAIFRQVILAVL